MTYANYDNRTVFFNYNQKGHLPGCYITETVCKILGYPNECFVLTEMKKFANKVPETSENRKLTCAFDILEPMIAKKIEEEYETTKDKHIWVEVYNLFLSETANLMEAQKYHAAIGNYQRMMAALRQHFGLEKVDFSSYYPESDNTDKVHRKTKKLVPSQKLVMES